MINFHKITNINFLFIFIVFLLSMIGTIALYSAGDGNFDIWAKKHLIRFGASLIILFFICSIKIEIIYKFAYYIFFLSLGNLYI